ncbi:polyadenylate-binding protein 2-like isoform X4 [Branchiostoma floridae x Branchiostoma japonicum]
MADADSLLLEDTPDLTPDPTQADQLEHEAAAAENPVEDPELEAIKQRVREMEEEAEKLKEMQNEVERQMNLSPTAQRPGATAGAVGAPSPTLAFPSIEDKMEADGRSVYVGNVDYGATAEELEAHFHGCGSINRVTILCDKFTGHPKGSGLGRSFLVYSYTQKGQDWGHSFLVDMLHPKGSGLGAQFSSRYVTPKRVRIGAQFSS